MPERNSIAPLAIECRTISIPDLALVGSAREACSESMPNRFRSRYLLSLAYGMLKNLLLRLKTAHWALNFALGYSSDVLMQNPMSYRHILDLYLRYIYLFVILFLIYIR